MINEIRDEFITIHDFFTDFCDLVIPISEEKWEEDQMEFHSFLEEVFECVKRTVEPYTESWKEAFERGWSEGRTAGAHDMAERVRAGAAGKEHQTNMEKWGF